MRCPSCEADQPDGVTICGFCGSAMVRPPVAPEASAPVAVGGAAAAPERRSGPLVLAGLAFIVLGGLLFAWREVRRAANGPPAEAAAGGATSTALAAAPPPAAVPRVQPAAAPDAATRRLDEGDLWRLADDLERITAEGDPLELARRLEPGLRYRSEVVDAGELRRLDGGMPELLAHWLTPRWIEETVGIDGGDSPATVAVELGDDGRSGTIERSVDSAAEPSRATFPVPLLLRLARGIPISSEDLSALDLGPATRTSDRCHVDERLGVALTRDGLRVVEATRSGRCGL